MSIVSIILGIIIVINLILGLTVIFIERQNTSTTLAWLMVLIFLPIVGFVLYLIFNQNFTRKKMFKWDDLEKTGMDEKVVEQLVAIDHRSLTFENQKNEDYIENIYMHLKNDSALFTQTNDVKIYTDGREKFDALLEDIKHAKDHIHIQYYIIHDDNLGEELVDALTKKAEQGLEVRVLYDYMGSRGIQSNFYKSLE